MKEGREATSEEKKEEREPEIKKSKDKSSGKGEENRQKYAIK